MVDHRSITSENKDNKLTYLTGKCKNDLLKTCYINYPRP